MSLGKFKGKKKAFSKQVKSISKRERKSKSISITMENGT